MLRKYEEKKKLTSSNLEKLSVIFIIFLKLLNKIKVISFSTEDEENLLWFTFQNLLIPKARKYYDAFYGLDLLTNLMIKKKR